MTYEDYEKMMRRLNSIIGVCEKYIAPIKSKEDLYNMSLKDVMKLVEIAKGIQGEMDVIMTSELYHILGMACLSPMQELMFIGGIKQLLKYRSYVKAIAAYKPTPPTIPEKSDYKCKVLGVNLKKELQ